MIKKTLKFLVNTAEIWLVAGAIAFCLLRG